MTKMDSEGKNRTFSTGAVRDSATKKPMIHLISPFFLQDLGEWLRFACQDRKPEPYPPRNWEKGMPYSETLGSGFRHLVGIMIGDTSEDHIAALGFAAMALAHYRHEIKAGRMDPEIDDMPHYATPKLGDTRINPQTGQEETYMLWVDPAVVKPTIYIAGSMRGKPQLNFPAFDKAAELGRSKGFNIISPAELDRKQGIDPVNDPDCLKRIQEGIRDDQEFVKRIIKRDLGTILNLKKERGDGIAIIPGWQDSTGARTEVAMGIWLDLHFYDAATFGKINVNSDTFALMMKYAVNESFK